MMKTFLLTDGEFTGMIRTLRSLGDDVRVVGFCSSAYCAHSAMLDSVYTAPQYDSEEYIPFVTSVIIKEKVDYVFPVGTLSLEFFAEKKSEIESITGAVVISSNAESIITANDKSRLFAAVGAVPELSDAVTEYKIAKNPGELYEAVCYFADKGIQCVSKPVRGENAEGFFRIVSEKEYIAAVMKGEASHLFCAEAILKLPQDEAFPVPRLVMPYLPGKEYDVDFLCLNGEVLSATVRTNSDMFGGLSACSTTCKNEALFDLCRGIIKTLGLSFLCCLSIKEDENGSPKLLEINPRAMGSIHLSTLAGNNLVSLLLDVVEGKADVDSLINNPVLTKSGFTTSLYYDIIPVEKKNIVWHNLSPEDKDIYRFYYKKSPTRITDLTFNCRYAWDNVFKIKWAVIEDCIVQICFSGSESFMLMPLGELNEQKIDIIVKAVCEEFRSRGLNFRIACIAGDYLPLFNNLSLPHSEPAFNDDFSDYIYDAEALRSLKGRKYEKKRNHIHKFMNLYPDFIYEKISRDNIADCIKTSKNWARSREVNIDDTDECDHLMIERILNSFENLEAAGGAIKVNGKVVAFSIGSFEESSKTAFIHFEKADIDYDGAYAAINQLVLQNEFPEAVYVDREEDLGLENLRKAKKSYNPVEQSRKYSIRIY